MSLQDRNPPFGGKPHLSAAFLEAGSSVMPPGALVHIKPTLLFSAAVADLGGGRLGAQMCLSLDFSSDLQNPL